MTMTIKRICAGLAALLILVSLALPAFAKQVNTETDITVYGDYGDTDEPVGHLADGDPFWSEQPFDSYWTDQGFVNLSEPVDGRGGMWLITNYYYSGEGWSLPVDNPKFKRASYFGIRTVTGCRVYTDHEWKLEKKSDQTNGTVHELVYVGEVYTGDIIDTICTDYLLGTTYAINRYDNYMASNNDPSRPSDAFIAPTNYSCYNSNVRAVQRNGILADDAENWVWEQNTKADSNGAVFTGDAAMCGWKYTVQPGDELIYADCQGRRGYRNEYNGVEYDQITIRCRFIFVVMDSGTEITLPMITGQTGGENTNPGGSADNPPVEPDDGENWWDDLFGDKDDDTGSSGYLPPEPSKPETKPEGETLTEEEAAIIGTAGGAAVIGAAAGAAAGGGGLGRGKEEPPAPKLDPEAQRMKEIERQQEEERQRELERQKELERQQRAARQQEVERLQKELAEQQRQMKELEKQIKDEARRKAEEHKRYVDRLYTKYGVDPNQENAHKILRNTIRKEQIKNEQEAAAQLAEDAKFAMYEQLAKDISSSADISMELCASITGDAGKTVLAAYYTLKGTASRTAEAIARIAYNGKSYKDYSLGDYASDAWDLAHSAAQGTAEGAVKGIQSFADYNDPTGAKWKAGMQIGGEAAKEMWQTAREGGDLWDIAKAGARGTAKGTVNATISYALDKTVGKLGGKGSVVQNSRISNYGGVSGTIANKITSGDLVSGGVNTAVSVTTEKLGLNDALDKLLGGQNSHADAAAKAAKQASDAAKSLK